MNTYTYEQAVLMMRSDADRSNEVLWNYFDDNLFGAANRFANSEEFKSVYKLLELKADTNNISVADIGCGNGIASYAFALKGCDVWATDPDVSDIVGLGAVAKLAALFPENRIKTVNTSVENMPFESNSMDIVYARQCLHHFKNLKTGLQECARILKPGGIFIACREHVITNNEQLELFLNNHHFHQLHGCENAYRSDEYLSSLHNAGLAITHHLLPYDSVINYYPITTDELRKSAYDKLSYRFGSQIGKFLVSYEAVFRYYLKRLSRYDNSPGRLNSFIAKKLAVKYSS